MRAGQRAMAIHEYTTAYGVGLGEWIFPDDATTYCVCRNCSASVPCGHQQHECHGCFPEHIGPDSANVLIPLTATPPAATLGFYAQHTLAVVGMAVAQSDNAVGIPGVVGNGRGKVVSRAVQTPNGSWCRSTSSQWNWLFSSIEATGAKVVNVSSFQPIGGTYAAALRRMLVD